MLKKIGFIAIVLGLLIFLQPTLFKGLLTSTDARNSNTEESITDTSTRGNTKTAYAEGYSEEDFGAEFTSANQGMFPVMAEEQPAGPWEELLKLKFSIKFDEDVDDVIFEPKFTKKIKAFENKVIEIEGFIIPYDIAASAMASLDDDGQKFMFSAFPLASCFFCGGAGAESVMEVFPKNPLSYTDKKIKLKGKFLLNNEDYLQLPYILKDAVFVEDNL
jgi:hypothetical protein